MPNDVLIVDDLMTVVIAQKLMIRKLGYPVRTAHSGEEALQLVDDVKPGLILCDLLMPGMDGIEFCQHIKQNPITRDIPVFFVSTQGAANQQMKTENSGCDGFLQKPLVQAEVERVLHRYLH